MPTESIYLSELLAGIVEVRQADDCRIAALSLDSRAVKPGGLFLACAGGTSHGLEYIDQAIGRGAVAILWEPSGDWDEQRIERLAADSAVRFLAIPDLSKTVSAIAGRFYDMPASAMAVIGITGTNGKTSCSHFIAQGLSDDAGRSCAVIGTLGNGFPVESGDGNILETATHTTPDPVNLQRLLAEFRSEDADSVAVEVSSHALDQSRAAGVAFDIAAFTNLSREHLDYHGSMDAYGAAKARLFQWPGLNSAVINMDDPFGQRLIEQIPTGVKVIGYGLEADERLQRLSHWILADQVVLKESGMQVHVESSWGEGFFHTPLMGRFNISNLLLVLAVLLEREIDFKQALGRLSKIVTIAGRMEGFGGGSLPRVVVDYAHTPDALEQTLNALKPHISGQVVTLFGCGGDRDRGKRPLMGEVAERISDRVVVTDDNPRSEDGDQITKEILAGMERPERAMVERSRGRAIRKAIEGANTGDLVLIAGKGHENYQLVGDLTLPFSDRERVKTITEGEGM
ncbi:MAG: UDP-N-acetylmuramoyl-L-alanyl-D-glutamate--2,6-diaminopimelate ligase [Gammaproteobacteria bacterium]|nr:UDP-N-acetylmuramoyl-L-alanyl-D-glutamate--2,6-diaminopimelate ligase [Gammaproteobacteria bacterium]